LFEADAGVFGQVGRDRPERLVKAFGEAADLLGRVLGFSQRAAHGRACGFPGGSIEQADAGIGEAQARHRENVSAPERPAQPIDQTQGPGTPIDNAVRGHAVFPGLRHELRWPCRAARAAVFNLPKMMQGLQHRLTGRHGAQADDAHEVRQETPDAAVLRQQLVEVGIIGRPDQAVDLGHGGFEGSFGHGRENRCPETAVGDSAVEYQGANLAQGERRGVKIAQTAQPRFPAFADRVDEHPGDEQVEQIKRVILRACFQHPNERQQGGEAAFVR
jgi:hypothetical protein